MPRRDFAVLAEMGVTWEDLVEQARTGEWDGHLYWATYDAWRCDDDPPSGEPPGGASLLHLAGSGALDLLIDAHEPFRRDPDEAP